jgi:carboxymuconolactone decarboxylase family protein
MSPRDRSIETVAALIARIQTIEMPFHLALALDNGVKPRELSEIITHLAFYSGWANAMSAVAVAKDIFRQRGIGMDQLPPAKDKQIQQNPHVGTRPSHGRGRAFSPIPDESTRSRQLFSTILTDLRAVNVFEIAEFSLQVVTVLSLSNNDSLTLLTRLFEGHPRLVSCCNSYYRRAHNPKVGGSNPPPATNGIIKLGEPRFRLPFLVCAFCAHSIGWLPAWA